MKTLSEKEFNGFNVNARFTESAERAKKELSPLMQEIRKYIPQAEYGYHVVSGEYPAFYGVRIEFTYNGIRFHVYRINKENKYRIPPTWSILSMSTATTSKGGQPIRKAVQYRRVHRQENKRLDKLLHADIQAGGAGKCGELEKGSRLLEKYRERTRKLGT